MRRTITLVLCLAAAISAHAAQGFYNVLDFGAVPNDGRSDSAAINAAIEKASQSGGGTVQIPGGTYECFSIFLKDNVFINLDAGCVIKAAVPTAQEGYVQAGPDGRYPQWCGCLFYGDGVHDSGVTGQGLIDGTGVISRGFGSDIPFPVPSRTFIIRSCRNMIFRDFSVLLGGARVLWIVGSDTVTIDNLKVDTNRDGLDIDCCANVRISNCTVNCLNDDGIVLKSAYTEGLVKATENVTITNCQVCGYDPGTFLTGEFAETVFAAPDFDGPTGRIKLGTESVGGFKNITVSNCVFDRSRGIAIECVDGGTLEDVTFSNIAMRNIFNSPIFIRLGSRMRGPEGRPMGTIRRVNISNITAKDVDCRYGILLSGIPGYRIEDVSISNVFIQYKGGLSPEDARNQQLSNQFFTHEGSTGTGGPNTGGLPKPYDKSTIPTREPFDVPETEPAYPEPSMFGVLPVWGIYMRHASNVRLRNIQLELAEKDTRPAVYVEDVDGLKFDDIRLTRENGVPLFIFKNSSDIQITNCDDIKPFRKQSVSEKTIY